MNSFHQESTRAYRARAEARDKSARLQATLREREYVTDAKKLEPERLVSIEDLHRYLNETTDALPGDFVSSLPEAKEREELCRDFFQCNIWDVEPHLLDDLSRAQAEGNAKRVDDLRRLIRAGSWASHGRVDEKIAAELAQDYPRILAAIQNGACDEKAEAATRDVEELVAHAWTSFVAEWKKEKARNPFLEWPPEKVPLQALGYPKSLLTKGEALVRLRKIRDQVYFNLLNKNLCRIAAQAAFERRKRGV